MKRSELKHLIKKVLKEEKLYSFPISDLTLLRSTISKLKNILEKNEIKNNELEDIISILTEINKRKIDF